MIGTNDDNVKGRNDVQQADTIASASEAEENKELSEIEKEKAGENLEALGKDELKIKILEYKEIAEKNYDLYLRAEAEIDNLKKRFRKDKEDLGKFANESIIKELLPVVDNLRNAVSYAEEGNPALSLVEGVRLTLKMLNEVLKKSGLQEVKALGEDFDPNVHQAMMNQETREHKPGIVVKELQKGYLLNDRLIRPSMVVVSKSPS